MRRRRIKRIRSRRRYQYSIIILFFLIIPLVAVFIGSEITKKIMIPVFYSDMINDEEVTDIVNKQLDNDEVIEKINKDNDSKEESKLNNKEVTDTEEIIRENIDPFTMYLIQVASVSNIGNAEEFVTELNEKHLSHLISKIDNNYKVYTSGASNRELVERELDDIRKFYPDAYIKEINIRDKKLEYPESNKEICHEIVNEINNYLKINDKLSKNWYTFVKKEGEIDSYVEVMQEEIEIVKKLSNMLGENILPDNFISKKDMEIILDQRKDNNELALGLLKENKDLHKVHNLYLEGLFKFIEVIK